MRRWLADVCFTFCPWSLNLEYGAVAVAILHSPSAIAIVSDQLTTGVRSLDVSSTSTDPKPLC